MSVDEKELVASVPDGLFIEGEWRPASGGEWVDVVDPATTRPLARVADATADDAVAALDAAAGAQASWARHAGPRARRDPAPLLTS